MTRIDRLQRAIVGRMTIGERHYASLVKYGVRDIFLLRRTRQRPDNARFSGMYSDLGERLADRHIRVVAEKGALAADEVCRETWWHSVDDPRECLFAIQADPQTPLNDETRTFLEGITLGGPALNKGATFEDGLRVARFLSAAQEASRREAPVAAEGPLPGRATQ